MNGKTKELCSLFLKLRTLDEVQRFLSDLLTPKEMDAVIERWEIVKRLEKGISQREISQELGTGIMTVTRGAAALKRGSGGFRLMLDKAGYRTPASSKKRV